MDLSAAGTALKKYFGYDAFRPMQAEIIEAVLQGRDTLVLMPTGGGKSICYQIPALIMPGVAVVISPLISLMKDQVEALRSNGVKAAFLNSSLEPGEQNAVEDDFFRGNIDLLYVSPEKLLSQSFRSLLGQAPVSLFAIDEAHCISAWGHDFRPEYTRLRFIKAEFAKIPIIALTATADKITRQDIVTQIQLQEPGIFVASFDRPNLSLEVRPGQKRLPQILQFLNRHPKQAGIIYCLSRRNTEELARKLRDNGIDADHYHAGLSDQERSRTQEAFTNDNTQVICATIAFGMGIDKSNVRWVIHYNLPKNIESYYQEIGRAGRDGARADTLLFYSYGDVATLRNILENQESEQKDLQLAKLDRMQQYAESLVCRRRILLNYFGENFQENCGNCDVCRNPPQYFDGTIIAQKALSAVYRLREKVGLSMLINVLRGATIRELFENGYHEIKTYGAGRDISTPEWQYYLMQLLHLGYLEIAYERHQTLKLTAASHRVLFGNEKVQLVRLRTFWERKQEAKKKARPARLRERRRDDLFEELRALRKQLAREKGLPPYIIFNDATLEEMAARRPTTDEEMRDISGVGERKLHLYGNLFIDAIQAFIDQED